MPLSEEDKAEVAKLISAAFAGDEFVKGLNKSVELVVGKAIKGLKLEETVQAVVEKLKPADDDKKGDDKKGDTGDVTQHPEFRKLQAKMQEQEQRAQRAEADRQAALLANGVRDALAAHGADAKRVPIALSHLREKGVVVLSDKGEPCFKFQRDWGEELVPVTTGAKEWLGTEEGKFFLPPTGAQGTGDGAGKGSTKGGSSTTSAESIALDALMNLNH